MAETIPGVQDGGVVSALLIELLEQGEIDGALVAKPSEREPWKGVAHLAQTPEDVIACAGELLQPDAGVGTPRPQEVRPAAEAADRPGRDTLRNPGAARHAGASLLLGRLQGRLRWC